MVRAPRRHPYDPPAMAARAGCRRAAGDREPAGEGAHGPRHVPDDAQRGADGVQPDVGPRSRAGAGRARGAGRRSTGCGRRASPASSTRATARARRSTGRCSTRCSGSTAAERAVVTLLLLRGPQTPGELRSRSDRLHDFDSSSRCTAALHMLSVRDEPLVEELPRQPGQKETRWIHRLGPVGGAAVDPRRRRRRRSRPAPSATPRSSRRTARWPPRTPTQFLDELDRKPFDRWLLERIAALSERRPRRRRRLRARPDHRLPRHGGRRGHRLRPVSRHGRRGSAPVPRARRSRSPTSPRSPRRDWAADHQPGTRSCTSHRRDLPAAVAAMAGSLPAGRLARRSRCTRAPARATCDEWFGHAGRPRLRLPRAGCRARRGRRRRPRGGRVVPPRPVRPRRDHAAPLRARPPSPDLRPPTSDPRARSWERSGFRLKEGAAVAVASGGHGPSALTPPGGRCRARRTRHLLGSTTVRLGRTQRACGYGWWTSWVLPSP